MQTSDQPSVLPVPFANAGTKNTIPTAASPTPGLASLTEGFPPLTFTPLASGGIPPSGADFNGILYLITLLLQWQNAGGSFKRDATFQASIGGYPKGAVLLNAASDGFWLCLADSNTTNPDDLTTATNWAPICGYGTTAIAGLTNANVTLTAAQCGRPIITLAGVLTGNVQIIFPAIVGEWLVINNTTGAFSATCKTAAGTGAIIPQGQSQKIIGDGTNIGLGAITKAYGDTIYAALAGLAGQAFAMATAAVGTNTTQGASTAFVIAEIANQFSKAGQQSLAATGYQKLPGGLILQWGTASVNNAGTTITFPVAFPTACYNAQVTNRHQGAFDLWAVDTFTTTTMIGWANNPSTTNGYWVAIGK